MLILGLLLLAATAAFTGLAISDNLTGGPHYTVSVLGNDIATMNTLEIFCAGLALALIFSLGLWMAVGGALHRRTRKARLRNERDALAARLSESEGAAGSTTAAGVGAAAPTSSATGLEGTPAPHHRARGRRIHLFGH
ncbi:hypothetical protein ACFFS2_32635 [Streptomyces aurantiacus]|uniref:LapA family protein n=1 Tax=Streptomyces aurantiacus TaxID=47760 RepID=A0A7G1P1Q1_9ACTN|nr:hypothetical protein [Streptomyces aurantiacus]BCL27716.1 hypothetical protein GCM10017557_25750 [Streptomyces aurantiacus]